MATSVLKKCLIVVTWMLAFNSGFKTTLSIKGTNFYINNEITYSNGKNKNVTGLLLNARMINAIFDDANEGTLYLWKYPDTGQWDPNRNTDEFVGNISMYKSYGMLSFTVGLQGGNPFGYEFNEPNNISGQPWINSAFKPDGSVVPAYFSRIEQIIETADDHGMIPIVQLFYGAQQGKMNNDNARMLAINNTLDWILSKGYTNILIEVANECNYNNDILSVNNMANIIKYMREYTNGKYYIGSSTGGGYIPPDSLISAADFVLLHGNGQNYNGITHMIDQVRASNAYKSEPKPIVFNEDDHYNFSSPTSNFEAAITRHASWGLFADCNQQNAGDYIHGYQCVPPSWNHNTQTKQSWFDAVKSVTT